MEIARDTIEGKMELSDLDAVKARLEAAAGVPMELRRLPEKPDGNFYLLTSGSVVFGRDEF